MQASYLSPQARELGAERRPVRRVFGMRVAHEVADQRGIALGEHQRATETVGVCRERSGSNPRGVLSRSSALGRLRTWQRSRIVRAWLAMVRPIAWLN